MPEAVLFDLYDTLAWSDWHAHSSWLADSLGVSTDEVMRAYETTRHQRDGGSLVDATAVLEAVARACRVEVSPAELSRLASLEADLLADTIRLYDDSLPALRDLRRLGVGTAVVSNCSPSTRPVVDELELEEVTDVVVLSCEVGAAKPSPRIFSIALEALGVSPESAVFVDDRTDYLDGAAALGMRTFRIVRHLPSSRDDDVASGDHPVVSDLRQLLDAL